MSDMSVQWLFEPMALLASDVSMFCYAEPERRPIRSIRTLKGQTSKFGWLRARDQNCCHSVASRTYCLKPCVDR